jgi:hypothetical protein
MYALGAPPMGSRAQRKYSCRQTVGESMLAANVTAGLARHSSSATIFFLRSGRTLMLPGALCAMRRCSLRLSASCTLRLILAACVHSYRTKYRGAVVHRGSGCHAGSSTEHMATGRAAIGTAGCCVACPLPLVCPSVRHHSQQRLLRYCQVSDWGGHQSAGEPGGGYRQQQTTTETKTTTAAAATAVIQVRALCTAAGTRRCRVMRLTSGRCL